MSRKLFTLSICILLVSCNLPGAQVTPQPQAWFDMPLPDTPIYLPNLCQVIAHGSSPKGVAFFELSIQGSFVSNIPAKDSKQTLATLDVACPPLAPGKNIIELRVQDTTGEWSDPTQTTVILVQRNPATATSSPRTTATPASTFTTIPTLTATLTPTRVLRPTLTPIPTLTATLTPTRTLRPTLTLIPTLTATLTPTRTPTKTSTPQSTSGVTVERVSTNLVYLGRSSCGPLEVAITVRATAPNRIKVAVLFYRFQTASSSTEFQSVSMNSIGGDLYERVLNPTSLLGGSVPFDQATLQYQIVIQQNNGDTTIRTAVLSDISVQACGGITSCSSYTTESSCVEHGCSWVSIPAIVPTYECRNP